MRVVRARQSPRGSYLDREVWQSPAAIEPPGIIATWSPCGRRSNDGRWRLTVGQARLETQRGGRDDPVVGGDGFREADRSGTLFSDDAVTLIHEVSRGLPRQTTSRSPRLIAAFAANKGDRGRVRRGRRSPRAPPNDRACHPVAARPARRPAAERRAGPAGFRRLAATADRGAAERAL